MKAELRIQKEVCNVDSVDRGWSRASGVEPGTPGAEKRGPFLPSVIFGFFFGAAPDHLCVYVTL